MDKLNIDMAYLALRESEAEVKRLKAILFQLIPEKEEKKNGEKEKKKKKPLKKNKFPDSKQNQFT